MMFVTQNNFENAPGISDLLLGFYFIMRVYIIGVCSASENSYDLKQKYSKWKNGERLRVRREVGSVGTINM